MSCGNCNRLAQSLHAREEHVQELRGDLIRAKAQLDAEEAAYDGVLDEREFIYENLVAARILLRLTGQLLGWDEEELKNAIAEMSEMVAGLRVEIGAEFP